ncbi:MAG: hypothetical protein ACYC44_01790 [Patescibacteria group bacterium]
MTRSLSLATVEDLIKVLDKDFVPGSTVTMADIAVPSEPKLTMPVLPVYSDRVDLREICLKPGKVQILAPLVLDNIAEANRAA